MNCGVQTLRELLYLSKGIIIQPRGDISSFKDLIDEAKLYITLIPQKTSNLAKITPCIVKFGREHYILVTKVYKGIVYYSDNGLPCQLPLDDFTSWWKGEALSEFEDLEGHILTEEECLKIIGFKKGKDILATALPIIAGFALGPLGPIVAGLGSAATSALTQKYMSSSGTINPLQVGLSGLTGGFTAGGMAKGATAAKAGTAGTTAGYGGQLWAGGRTLLGMTPTSAATAGTVGGTWPTNLYSTAGDIAPGASTTSALKAGSIMQYAPQTGWSAVNTANQLNAVGAGAKSPTSGAAEKGVFGALTANPSQTAMSLLSSGISSGMSLPAYSPDTSYLRAASEKILGGSPLSGLATERAMQIMSGQPLTAEDEKAITDIYNQREEDSLNQVDKTYQQYGRLGSEEHKSERQKVKDYWNTQRAYGLQTARKDAQAMQNNMIQAAWGYDQNQVTQLLALAEQTGDIDQINWAIKAGDTMGVKSIFDKLAQLAWPQQNQGISLNLLGKTA